jgi:hypothetical protein
MTQKAYCRYTHSTELTEAELAARHKASDALFQAIEILVRCGHKDLALDVRVVHDTHLRVWSTP